MEYKHGDKIKLKVELIIEVSSSEYETVDSILDEFASETDYNVTDTDNVKIHDTELRDCYLQAYPLIQD